jgi:Tol biopolymer transport system component
LIDKGTLARAPLAGGSPREILEDVSWADWDANGELAIIHHAAGRYRIEYPLGRVLYQSEGWISHLRFSPHLNKIAFINHPSLWDDRGSVFLIDLSGKTEVVSKEWDSADGVAWTADGEEIWFTAADKGYTRGLFALSGKGKVRNVLTIPAGMTLQDIAPDGRVLVSLDAERLSMATSLRGGKPLDISWHDWDIAKDISRDGKSVLFEDASEAAGTSYSVALRRIDGSAPVQLGDGSAGGLSPDGQWAIAIITGTPGSITLYPVGPGTPRRVPVTGLETIDNGTSHFLPDGKTITVNGNEPGHGVRCYLVNVETGKLTPATPEGITGGLVSPDGKFIIANTGTNATMYPISGGAARLIPNIDPGFVALQWSEDNSAIYGYLSGEIPTGVYKINIATGERTLVQELSPETAPGLVTIKPVVVSHDLSRFAYSYYQVLSVLYVISGLR